MGRTVLTMVMVLLFAGTGYAKTEVYGSGVTLDEATPVSAILDNPETFDGKPVRIEGMILEVCAKRGSAVLKAPGKTRRMPSTTFLAMAPWVKRPPPSEHNQPFW